jgi:hypothetical protein
MPNKQESKDEVTGAVTQIPIADVLARAQAELPKAEKSSENPYFKNKYAGLDDVIKATRAVLNKHGIAVTQTVDFSPESVEVREDGVEVRKAMQAFLKTSLLYGTQGIHSLIPLEYKRGDAQSLGSAMTYAKRYGLQGITCLETDEPDDDANAAVGSGTMDKKAPYKKRGNSEPKVEATAGDFLK